MAAVAFNISLSCNTKGCVNNSNVSFADTAFVLNKLNIAPAASVIVRVILSAFPESSLTIIDLSISLDVDGAVTTVVAVFAVKSTFAF